MTLFEKIMAIYPALTETDFGPRGTIILQNDLDEKGDYIAKWDHQVFEKPTDEQLKGI
jgi:hypothetical protein